MDNDSNDQQSTDTVANGNSEKSLYKKSKTFTDDPTYFRAEIYVPEVENYSFSFRKLWAFTGPGFLMSIAYLDPGNIESDLQAGTVARYQLLWVLFSSTILGLLVQRLAARLGVVTGKHLAELCYTRYPKFPRLGLWIMTEIAIIGSDMQEVIGTAIAIYLLSNKAVPLYAGVLITILDTFTFLLLDRYGLRKLEAFFGFLITIMAVTFGYEFFRVAPNIGDIAEGMFVPKCVDCDNTAVLQGVGIIGAIIMPHNLYLHSALVKSRKIDHKKKEEVNDANRYVFIESAVALGISLLINIAVTAVFAAGLNGIPESDVYTQCASKNDSRIDPDDLFDPDNNSTDGFDVDIYKAGIFLGCQFGMFPMYIWAIGILAAGQSSTMTGTYSGQFAMEGFLNLSWSRWKRVLLTRSIAIAPTLVVTLTSHMTQLSSMNDYLNALMSMMLPFALLPTLTFTSSYRVMGVFTNGRINKIIISVLSVAIISVNIYFVISLVINNFADNTLVHALVAIVGFFYLLFCTYLVGCYLVVLGLRSITSLPVIGGYFEEVDSIEFKYE